MSEHPQMSGESPAGPPPHTERRTRRLSWAKKLIFGGVTFAAFFALLEGLLALIGIPAYCNSYDPTFGLTPGVSLFVRDGDEFRTNDAKRTYFNPQRFPVRKSPNEFRVFCLGGSTTFGHPYDDQMSYSAMLRDLLKEVAPDRDWQVVNCGGISYASYRMVGLMQEIQNYQPDLVVVYAGENEFLEERTYRDVPVKSSWVASGIRLVGPLRLSTVIHRAVAPRPTADRRFPAEVNSILDNTVGPETYHRNSELRQQVIRQYQASLQAIARMAHQNVIFVIPASNLRFSPFKSERSNSAKKIDIVFTSTLAQLRMAIKEQRFQDAVALAGEVTQRDPAYAEAQFHAGEALLGVHSHGEARAAFQAAIDEDICPLRAISPIVQAMRDAGAELHRPVIDFPAIVATASRELNGHGIAGSETFLDHVHPLPELHAQLARELVRTMEKLGYLPSVPEGQLAAATERITANLKSKLTPTAQAMALNNLAMVLSWSGKNEEAYPLSVEAVSLDPTNVWNLCQLGRLQEKLGHVDDALQTHQRAVELDPQDSWAQYRLGKMLLAKGDLHEARIHLERGFQTTPPHAPLAVRIRQRQALADCYERLGDVATGKRYRDEAATLSRDAVGVNSTR